MAAAFFLLYNVANAASPQSFIATRDHTRILVVGVTHLSWHRDQAYEPHLSNILAKVSAIAVETLSTEHTNKQTFQEIFEAQENTKTYFSLSAELRGCVDEALASDEPIKRFLASSLKSKHLALLRIQLLNHRHLATTLQLRAGLDHLAEKRAVVRGLNVVGLESLRGAYEYDIGASIETLGKDIGALCRLINNEKLRAAYVLLSNRFLLEAHSLPLAKLDLLRQTLEQSLNRDFGLSDLTIASADKRNATLASAAITASCRHSQIAVFVGVVHLTGKDSLQNHLLAAGFKVEPVPWSEAAERVAGSSAHNKATKNECN